MNILMTLFIVMLAAAMVWLLRLYKTGISWAKPAALLCAVAALFLAVGKMALSGGKTAKEISSLHEKYQQVCGQVLGADLAERHPNARVVLLTPPNQDTTRSRTLLESLQASLEKGGLTVVLQPIEVPEEDKAQRTQPDQRGMTPEMREAHQDMMLMNTLMRFDAADLKKTLVDLKDRADLVVCHFYSPMHLEEAGLPRKGAGPALVVLNADIRDAQPLLKKTVLDTIVTYRSNPEVWKPGAKLPREKQAAFNQRYELITADNS